MGHQGAMHADAAAPLPKDAVPAWVDGRLVPVDKLEAHRRGLRHKAVSVFLLDGPRVLLQRRALDKYHTPGLWANTCCTHPHWGESPHECALRRLDEEMGIAGVALDSRDQVEYRADVGGGMIEHELVDIFVGKMSSTLRFSPNPAEVLDFRWIALDRLRDEVAAGPDAFTPWLRIYLARHSGQIFGTP
jgi:isopentenyl-diphosphate delta-isomerase